MFCGRFQERLWYLLFVLLVSLLVYQRASSQGVLLLVLPVNCPDTCKVYTCDSPVTDGCEKWAPYQAQTGPHTPNPSDFPNKTFELKAGAQWFTCDLCSPACNDPGPVDAAIPQLFPNPEISTCARCLFVINFDRYNCTPTTSN